MPNVIAGDLKADGIRFALVVARFNSFVTDRLLEGAVDTLKRHGASEADLSVIQVPGAWELPLALKAVAASGKYDAAVALGAVIRGGTPHFEHVSREALKGAAAAMLEESFPVGLGILTTDTVEQAIERAGAKAGNKGSEAAAAAMETVNLIKNLKTS
jgi:6,7-dimethyl-8-ribityllumazine synthase